MAMPQRDNLIDGIVKTDAPRVKHRDAQRDRRGRAAAGEAAPAGVDGRRVRSDIVYLGRNFYSVFNLTTTCILI